MKRVMPVKLFDGIRQSSERGGPVDGDIEIALHRDEKTEAARSLAKSKAEERKRIYQRIKQNPGISEIELRGMMGTSSGLTEWLRDGLVVRKNGKLYAS